MAKILELIDFYLFNYLVKMGVIFCFSKPKAPKIPDYQGLAKQDQIASNPDINSPLGSQKITYGPDGKPIVDISLNPTFQGITDQIGQQYQNLFGMGGNSQAVTDALMQRNQPFLDRNRQATENDLLIQGHNRGGEAWNAKQADLGRADTDARLAAILAGGQEQSRQADMLGSTLQNIMPQFQGYQANPNALNAAQMGYQGQSDIYNSKMGGFNNMLGGLFSLGGAALGGPLGAQLGGMLGGAASGGGAAARPRMP